MELAPHTGQQGQQKVAPQFLRTAKVLLLRRRTREAINLLRRGLNLDPGCHEAALLLSKTLLRAKRPDEAKAVLEKLVDRVEDSSVYILLTRLHLSQGDAEAAAETAERGLTRFPLDRRLAGLLIKADKILNDTTREVPLGASAHQAVAEEEKTTREHDSAEFLEEELPTPTVSQVARKASGNTATVQAPLPRDDAPLPQERPVARGPAKQGDACPRAPSAKGGDVTEAVQRYAESVGKRASPPPLPAAPDIASAVQQLIDPLAEEPLTPRRPLFAGLLGDGRAADQAFADADPHELGGATPPASPLAKQRQAQRRPGSSSQPIVAPGRRSPAETASQPGAPASSSSQPAVAQTSAERLAELPGRDDSRVAVPLAGQLVDVTAGLRQAQTASQPLALLPPEPRPHRRRWPLVLVGILIVLSAATVAGLLVRQHTRGETALARAQELAGHPSVGDLREALRQLRDAANLSGRSARVVALAAAIHGRLALEYGESDLQGTENLVAEAERLAAGQDPVAQEELAVAVAYLRLGRRPLTEAIGQLAKSVERYPLNMRLALLYAEALARNGELYLAERVLARLPRTHAEAARLQAQVAWREGKPEQAQQELQRAAELGLPHHLVLIDQAAIGIDEGAAGTTTLGQLESLANDPDLPTRQRAWANLLAAAIARQRGRRDLAGVYLQSAFQLRPMADPEFSFRAARLLFDLHRGDQALAEIKTAIGFSPRDQRTIQLAARIELSMNRVQEAVSRLSQLDERTAESQLLLAEGYLKRGDLSRAHQVLLQMEDMASPRRRYLLTRIHLARRHLRQAQDSLAGLERQGVELEQLYLLRGLIALRQERRAQAERDFKAALQHDPWQPEVLLQLGLLARQRHQGSEALHYLRQAVEANPYLNEARLALGELELLTGQPQAARQQFEAALAGDPSSIQALTGRARAAAETADDEAEPYLRTLRSRGHRQVADLLQARQQMSKGRWSEAISLLRTLADGSSAHQRQAQLWLARAYLGAGDRRQAERTYWQVVEQQAAPSPGAHLALSELLLAADRRAEALEQARAAGEALPRAIVSPALEIRIWVQLARCLRLSGDPQQAAARLLEVLELDRQGPVINLELARAYIALAQPKQAVGHLLAALRSSARGNEAMRELQQLCQSAKQPLDGCPP